MASAARIPYDELGLFHENAAEYGLPFGSPPAVRRESVALPDGRSLSALAWGTGPPEIVFLHGGGQNAHTWDTVALALRPRSLLCVDLPGHGHSDGPGDAQKGGAGPVGAAADVEVVVRKLAPDAKGVVGMSYGGMTAVALADRAPDLVRKLVLVDVLPGLEGGRGKHIVEFINGPPTFPTFDDILARTIKYNPTRSESSLRRGILHNAVQLEDGSWVWRHSRWRIAETEAKQTEAGADKPRPIAADLLGALGKIKVPVLLARGMRPDSVLRDDDEERLKQALPSAEVLRFQEAGHSIQGDMPVELAKAIGDFIG
ncbi:alpha/beta hydrolase fold protein [Hyaloraphidium curvatum]|nr:alpha/beta hydrolase fold protein [Hyaloraphidium curvatum]